jgi:thioredoxin 1
MGDLLTLTDKNFEDEVIKSQIPVLIDFWAAWCAPCYMVAPIVEELAEEYDGKLKVGKLDVDSHGSIAQRYKVLAIPTLLIFKEGKVVSQIIGATPKKDLKHHIDKILA